MSLPPRWSAANAVWTGSSGSLPGSGSASTPFLPPELFSTEFMTPVASSFLAFASIEPGTVTVTTIHAAASVAGTSASETHDLQGSNGLYAFRFGESTPAGTRVHTSVPVWGMMDVDGTPQLLYGLFAK